MVLDLSVVFLLAQWARHLKALYYTRKYSNIVKILTGHQGAPAPISDSLNSYINTCLVMATCHTQRPARHSLSDSFCDFSVNYVVIDLLFCHWIKLGQVNVLPYNKKLIVGSIGKAFQCTAVVQTYRHSAQWAGGHQWTVWNGGGSTHCYPASRCGSVWRSSPGQGRCLATSGS